MVNRPEFVVVVLFLVFRFVTVAFAIGSLSFSDSTVPETVFSCAMEDRQRINSGTISVNRLIISISRSLENEDKEKSELGTMISQHLTAEKNAIRQKKQYPKALAFGLSI